MTLASIMSVRTGVMPWAPIETLSFLLITPYIEVENLLNQVNLLIVTDFVLIKCIMCKEKGKRKR